MKQNAKKNMPLVKQNVMKLEVVLLGRQRIEEKEGMGRGRREKIEKGSRERIEIETSFSFFVCEL